MKLNTLGQGVKEGTDHGRAEEYKDEYQDLRKVQVAVATSTFGGMAFVGLFCTCLWLSCCRFKRTTRIRGRTWDTQNSFTVNPDGTITHGPSHIHGPLDPQGLYMNPYLINPNHIGSEMNLSLPNGMYRPSTTFPYPGQTAYKPFFSKPEWQPPEPPSYDTLGFPNPGYEHDGQNNGAQSKPPAYTPPQELINERIPTSVLAASDPTKMINISTLEQQTMQMQQVPPEVPHDGNIFICDCSKAGGNYHGGNCPRFPGLINPHDVQTTSHTGIDQQPENGRGSAPLESMLSIDSSNDVGHPYPNGIPMEDTQGSGSGATGSLEEMKPPPFNPGYIS